MKIYIVYFDSSTKLYSESRIEGAYKTFKEAEKKFKELLDYYWIEGDCLDIDGYTYDECLKNLTYHNIEGNVIIIEKVNLND